MFRLRGTTYVSEKLPNVYGEAFICPRFFANFFSAIKMQVADLETKENSSGKGRASAKGDQA
jgi:hypothetical protein